MKERIYEREEEGGTRRACFFIEKKIYLQCESESYRIANNLQKLNTMKNDFNEVNFPDFTINRSGKILIIKSQFIKGYQLLGGSHTKRYHRSYIDIIKRDLVERDDEFSVTDYNPANFIIEHGTGNLYYVDLEGIAHSDPITRMKKFYERFLL